MSSKKKWSLKKFFKARHCGCGPNSTDIIEPNSKTSLSSQKPIVVDDDYTSTTYDDHSKFSKFTVTTCPKIRGSLAVVKESDDPYRDFRQSMLHMILEKEIYSRNDLEQLLECFLRLNAPHHHEVIVEAFMEIWNCGVSDGGGEEETTSSSSCRVT